MKEKNEAEKADSGTIEIPVGKYVGAMRRNPWVIISLVLVVLLVVVFIFRGGGVSGSVVSEKTAEQNVLNFVNSRGQGSATIVSTQQVDGFYQITLNYQNQTIPVYVTLDGKNLVPTVVPLTGDAVAPSNTQTPTTPTTPTGPVNIDTTGAPVLGSVTAPVTVVEFADFSCPYCAAASGDNPDMITAMKQNSPTWEPIVTNLIKDYVNTGKVKLISMYSMGHTGGHPAQLVAWCLNDQSSDLFWKFYPQAYANQKDVEDITKMTALAKTLGADMTKLQSCLDSKKYDNRFTTEQSEGSKDGVQGTPAFFVNGQLIEGAQPYSVVKQAVDAALAAK